MENRSKRWTWGIVLAVGLVAVSLAFPPAGRALDARIGLSLSGESSWPHVAPDGTYAVSDGVWSWLPDAGTTSPGTGTPVPLNLVARVIDIATGTVVNDAQGNPLPVTMQVTAVSAIPGDYTNDGIANSPEQDFVEGEGFQATSTMTLHPQDWGGNIKFTASNAQTGVSASITLPFDSDGDDLPDSWELEHATDLTVLNKTYDGDHLDGSIVDNVGDGLTAFEEYRGFYWGDVATMAPNNVYNTQAYLPARDTEGALIRKVIRTDPTRYDLFVIYGGFPGSYTAYTADPVGSQPPFAFGDAFHAQGIDVHPWDMDAPAAGGWGDPRGTQDKRIDLVEVVNNTTGHYGNDDWYINRDMPAARDWSFDTLGQSVIGNDTQYGSSVGPEPLPTMVFYGSLDHYFTDLPYTDAGDTGTTNVHPHPPFPMEMNHVLDPVGGTCGVSWSVEDQNDDGVLDKTGSPCGPGTNKEDGDSDKKLDGDHMDPDWMPGATGHSPHQLSPYDIDQDDDQLSTGTESHGVETPRVGDVGSITTEYSRAQVLKHVITHEMGHAVGADHQTEDDTGVMYYETNNWLRDGKFAPLSTTHIWIHNLNP